MSFADAQMRHGVAKQMRGDMAGAITHYRRVLKRHPRHPHALYFAALAAYQLKRLEEAIRLMRVVVQVDPKHADAWYNLGKFYQDTREPHYALDHYIAALEQNENHIEALTNAGNIYLELGHPVVARACYERALQQDATRPEARYNRAFVKLQQGDYLGGWGDYESRWQCGGFWTEYGRPFMQKIPAWDGSPMLGQRLLLHAEQGLGDTLQFVRYVPDVLARTGARIWLEVQPPLKRLVEASMPSGVTVFTHGEAIPPVDAHCSLMSLPHRMGTTTESVPWTGPYLHVERAPRSESSARRIGVCWAGSSGHLNDHNRSMPIGTLAPLFDTNDAVFYSLQVGERAHEGDVHGLARFEPSDFADTAAYIARLDLVITVDTSVAHLAGALGKLTWLMLPTSSDFRWMLDREDTPWYPTMRIWRQAQRGDWASMVASMSQALKER